MASVTLADAAALLNFRGRTGINRQYIREFPELAFLVYELAGPGSTCNWTVSFQSATTTIYATPGSDYPAPAPGIEATASLNYFEATRTAGVVDLVDNLAALGTEIEGLTSLRDLEVDKEGKVILKTLSESFYTGNPGASPVQLSGLNYVCTTSTFAGINPGTSGQETWVGVTDTETVANFAADPVGATRTKLTGACAALGYKPDFGFTTHDIINQILSATSTAESQVRAMPVGNGLTVADLGGVAVIVDGTLFIPSPNCPSGTLYCGQRGMLRYRYVPQAMSNMQDMAAALSRLIRRDIPANVVQQLLTGQTINMPPIGFDEIAKTGTQRKLGLVTQGQMFPTERRAFGRLQVTG